MSVTYICVRVATTGVVDCGWGDCRRIVGDRAKDAVVGVEADIRTVARVYIPRSQVAESRGDWKNDTGVGTNTTAYVESGGPH